MPISSLADAGFATTACEAAAASLAAGAVVGSFVAATFGMVCGWSRTELERRALRDSYGGAFVGLLCLVLDLAFSYLGL